MMFTNSDMGLDPEDLNVFNAYILRKHKHLLPMISTRVPTIGRNISALVKTIKDIFHVGYHGLGFRCPNVGIFFNIFFWKCSKKCTAFLIRLQVQVSSDESSTSSGRFPNDLDMRHKSHAAQPKNAYKRDR